MKAERERVRIALRNVADMTADARVRELLAAEVAAWAAKLGRGLSSERPWDDVSYGCARCTILAPIVRALGIVAAMTKLNEAQFQVPLASAARMRSITNVNGRYAVSIDDTWWSLTGAQMRRMLDVYWTRRFVRQ